MKQKRNFKDKSKYFTTEKKNKKGRLLMCSGLAISLLGSHVFIKLKFGNSSNSNKSMYIIDDSNK